MSAVTTKPTASPAAIAAAQRILDREARRLLAERIERERQTASPEPGDKRP
ncbi:MAG: hypothetical protein ACLQMH_13540 [Solirubrobacteraceae bacterium]